MNRQLPLFPLGQVVATPGALDLLDKVSVSPGSLIERHRRGDWGDVPADDAKANVDALSSGARLLSSYRIAGNETIWIITEADRSATTVLLPAEY